MKNKTINIILILILVINFALIFVVYTQIRNTKREFLDNPLIYGAKKLREVNGVEVLCQCNLMKKNSATLYFNSEEMRLEYPYDTDDFYLPELNMPKIIITDD